MNRMRIPMKLQFFADPETTAGETGGTGGAGNQQTNNQQPGSGQTAAGTSIDYAKIQQMLDGTLAAKEDVALKAYFKNQGLSQQEAEQAMAVFKAEKAKNQPDVNAMQNQLAQSQALARQAQVESAATLAAVALGIDAKSIPYVLKMADLSQAVGRDGKINDETIKNALNKVLEDVPALKPQAAGSSGFVQVGAPGNQQNNTASDEALKRAFGL